MTLSILLTQPWDVSVNKMPHTLEVPTVAPHRFSWKRAGTVAHPRGPWQVFPQQPDTSDDAPDEAHRYIETTLENLEKKTTLPGAVKDAKTGTHLNPACKLLLMSHAFEALECAVVGLRTENFNFRSQAAIEKLGAKKDGVIRHHAVRRDGTIRDSVMYSILAAERPDVKRNLLFRLN